MTYIHIKNLEKFNPGYTDRKHIWAKIYWDIFLDENFQALGEIDRYRLISLIVSEVYRGKPIPLTNANLTLMGWDIKKHPISLTLQMLHTFISDSNIEPEAVVTQSRVKKNRIEESRVEKEGNNDNNTISKGKGVSKDKIRNIIDDLNDTLNTSYKYSSSKTQELIKARLNEGFTVIDFKTVHRKMAKAWGVDNKMRQYLRPQTLYSNKFESYLNRPDDLRMGTAGVKTMLAGQEWIKEKEGLNAKKD